MSVIFVHFTWYTGMLTFVFQWFKGESLVFDSLNKLYAPTLKTKHDWNKLIHFRT